MLEYKQYLFVEIVVWLYQKHLCWAAVPRKAGAQGAWLHAGPMKMSSGSGGFKVGEESFVPAAGMKLGAVFTCNTT